MYLTATATIFVVSVAIHAIAFVSAFRRTPTEFHLCMKLGVCMFLFSLIFLAIHYTNFIEVLPITILVIGYAVGRIYSRWIEFKESEKSLKEKGIL